MKLRVLAFVNHVPADKDPTPVIERALQCGIDCPIAQGAQTDWGPHRLGSDKQLPWENFVENMRNTDVHATHQDLLFSWITVPS
jgi:hypothetical protein